MVGQHSEKMDEIFYTLELEFKLFLNLKKEQEVEARFMLEVDQICDMFPQNVAEDLDALQSDYFPEELIKENLKALSYKFLVKKKLNIRRLINNYSFYKYSMSELTNEALKINLTTKTHRNSSDNDLNVPSVSLTFIDKIRYSGLRSIVFRLMGLITTWLGFWIILGEVLIMTNWDLSFIRKWAEDCSFIVFQVTTMLPFYYLVIAVYWSYFNLKIEGFVGLHKKNTDSISLLFYAQ
jgi:hypothetical protein